MNIKDRKLKKTNALKKKKIFKNLVKISFKAITRGCLSIFSKYADCESLCLQNVSELIIRGNFFT